MLLPGDRWQEGSSASDSVVHIPGGGVIMDDLPVYKAPGVPEMIEASGATLL